ncbi:hypothetical protein ES705_14573 [subsurface metagenome]
MVVYTTADIPLYVEAQQIGAAFEFKARVFVEDPAGSGNWRRATSGEVSVKLSYLGEWWQLATEMETKNTNASGECIFSGWWEAGKFTMEAKHLTSGDIHKVRIECFDDGTYTTEVEIQ